VDRFTFGVGRALRLVPCMFPIWGKVNAKTDMKVGNPGLTSIYPFRSVLDVIAPRREGKPGGWATDIALKKRTPAGARLSQRRALAAGPRAAKGPDPNQPRRKKIHRQKKTPFAPKPEVRSPTVSEDSPGHAGLRPRGLTCCVQGEFTNARINFRVVDLRHPRPGAHWFPSALAAQKAARRKIDAARFFVGVQRGISWGGGARIFRPWAFPTRRSRSNLFFITGLVVFSFVRSPGGGRPAAGCSPSTSITPPFAERLEGVG